MNKHTMILASKYLAVASAVLLVLLGQDVSGSRDVIDDEPLADGSIVDQLCDHHLGQHKRISRISSIPKLHGYFNSLPDAKQVTCRDFYLQPLTELKALLGVGSENVCSAEMMDQINSFHWRYVVGSLSKRWRKASEGTLPEPLRIFFMNYAQEVTEKCKDTLMRRLELAAGHSDITARSLNQNKFGYIIDQLSAILQPQDKIKKHDDFMLIWDQFADKERRKGRSVDHKVDPATGETVYLSFRTKNPEGGRIMQKRCRQELRPIYGQTVLPVMRVLSIGYGRAEKHPRQDVAGSELVKNWYAITQLCQLLLPVDFHKDRSLEDKQAAVSAVDETTELTEARDSSALSEIASVEIGVVQLADVLPNATDEQIVKLVKSNMESRSHVYRQVVRSAFRVVGGGLKSTLKNIFITEKVDGKQVVESGEAVIKEPLVGLADDDDDDLEERKPSSLVREKRGTFGMVMVMSALILVVAAFLCAIIIPLVFIAG